MRTSFRLGQIAGIRIGVNWSVLVIFAIIAWGLATSRFPAAYPQYATGTYVAAAVLTAGAFFASLLAHELSHALVARRTGLQVGDITLWLFGGVARLSGEASNPGAELRIAGIGPLVSLVLGLVFLVVAGLLEMSGYHGLVLAGFTWLGGINVALAVFNVIPAAPLDGGRAGPTAGKVHHPASRHYLPAGAGGSGPTGRAGRRPAASAQRVCPGARPSAVRRRPGRHRLAVGHQPGPTLDARPRRRLPAGTHHQG